MKDVARSLGELYRKDLAEEEKLRLREEIFTRSQKEWARQIADRPTHHHRGYSRQKLNNAVIAHYLLYLKDLELFESIYQAEGKDLARLVELIDESIQDSGDPFETVQDLLERKQS